MSKRQRGHQAQAEFVARILSSQTSFRTLVVAVLRRSDIVDLLTPDVFEEVGETSFRAPFDANLQAMVNGISRRFAVAYGAEEIVWPDTRGPIQRLIDVARTNQLRAFLSLVSSVQNYAAR